ncbi:hypothetical protein SCA6_019565 [Theobroma cacao]
MAVSPESMPEKPLDFRAPPPSPIASGRRSCVTNDDVLSEFLEHSLRVPDLILPDKVFPRQKFIENPPKIDFQLLSSMESDSVPKILDSIATIGCFQLVNYGIPGESIRSALAAAAGIFQLPPEKRTAVTRSPEKLYGFEEVHGEEEGEQSEEFVWCRGEGLKLEMEGIWTVGYSNFSEKMETLLSDIEKVAEKILLVIKESSPQKSVYENDMMQGQDIIGSACYLYKHSRNVSADQWSSSLRYDVIRMLIRGIDYSHALCLHICDESSEFHVYSKKGWVSFCPEKDALVITVGDQTQALSGGQFKHVIGRPIYKGEKEDYISMAFLYSPPPPSISSRIDQEKGKTISLSQQAMAAILLTLVYRILVYVQIWFQEKQMETQSKQRPSPMALELFVDLSSANSSKPPGSLRRHKGKVEDLKELSFEARSSKDYAWYDVDSFLTYRVLSTGELEVRVRFSGFAKTEDEWVNVEKAVRERSIPLEPSECNMVKIGDLVLCYQDREHYQVYYDAHVVDIQRRVHDVRGCSCIFVVCYDHDYSKLLLFAVFGNPKLYINVGIYLSFMPTPGKGSAAEVMLQASAIGFLGSPASKIF